MQDDCFLQTTRLSWARNYPSQTLSWPFWCWGYSEPNPLHRDSGKPIGTTEYSVQSWELLLWGLPCVSEVPVVNKIAIWYWPFLFVCMNDVAHLHSNGIVHRVLKNVFIYKNELTILIVNFKSVLTSAWSSTGERLNCSWDWLDLVQFPFYKPVVLRNRDTISVCSGFHCAPVRSACCKSNAIWLNVC